MNELKDSSKRKEDDPSDEESKQPQGNKVENTSKETKEDNPDAEITAKSESTVPLTTEDKVGVNDVPGKQSVSGNLLSLQVPFQMTDTLYNSFDIESSIRDRFFHLKCKDMIVLTDIKSTIPKIIEHFYKHFDGHDKLLMSNKVLTPNPFAPEGRYLDVDPMGIENVIKTLRKSRFSRYNPPFWRRDGEEIPHDTLPMEIGVEADVAMHSYDKQYHSVLHIINELQLEEDDILRKYVRQLDDEFIFTDPRPFAEDRVFVKYYLPIVNSNQFRQIMDSTPLIWNVLYERKLAQMQKYVKFAAFSQATTFDSLLKVIEVQSGRPNQKNEFVKNVSPDRADGFMKRLMVVLTQNRYFQLSYSLSFEVFSITTLMECICAHLILPESTVDQNSRRQISNYLLEYLFKRITVKKAFSDGGARGRGDYRLNTLEYAMPVEARNEPSRLKEAIEELSIRLAPADNAAGREGFSRNQIRDAFIQVFCQWSRGGDLDPGEFTDTDVAEGVGARSPPEDVGDGLEEYHIRPLNTYVPVTNKTDTDYEIPWTKIAALRIVSSVLSSNYVTFRYRARGMANAVTSLIDWMASRFYYELQGYSIEFERHIRRLSLVPDSEMQTDLEGRTNVRVYANGGDLVEERRRMMITAAPGDAVSCVFSLAYKDMSMSIPTQDLCLDAWAHLNSMAEFSSHYQHITRITGELHEMYPLYEKYHRGWHNVEMAWKYTRNKTKFGSQVMAIFDHYHQMIFPAFEQLPVDPYYSGKLEAAYALWRPLLLSGAFGITDKYIVRPRVSTRFEPPGNPGVDDPYLFFNAFSYDETAPLLTHADLVRAMTAGNLDNLVRDDTVVLGVWQNVKVGAVQSESYLTDVIPIGGELKPITINMEYVWADIKERYNIRRAERFPVVASTASVVEFLDEMAWHADVWYLLGPRLSFLYPLSVVLKVAQSQR
jgi:hypothetical protein